MFVFIHLFLTFSAALGIARTSSALHSLARKFALRFSAALGIARTSSALHSLARKFQAHRPRLTFPGTAYPVTIASLCSAFQALNTQITQ